MAALTAHQIEALDRYQKVHEDHAELFRPRQRRQIITDRARLEEFAGATGGVLGVAAETPFFLFVCDLVQDERRRPYVYSRLINAMQLKGGTNVAVVAVIECSALGEPGSFVLVEQERHATGLKETAIPRGFGEPGEDGKMAALRELKEETGYLGEDAEFLGESVIDSGAGDARVSFYRVGVTGRGSASPEAEEAISGVRLVTSHQLSAMVKTGEITDAFTIQALALAAIGF